MIFNDSYFFDENLSNTSKVLSKEESRHAILVLRLNIGDIIFITNGKGQLAEAEIISTSPKKCGFKIISLNTLKEDIPQITLAQALLKGRAIEDAFEITAAMGIKDLIPFCSEYSQVSEKFSSGKIDRMNSKAISSLKQSKGVNISKAHTPYSFKELIDIVKEYSKVILLEKYNDSQKSLYNLEVSKEDKILIIIGAEGGFSKKELESFNNLGVKALTMGDRRLRASIAGVVAVSTVLTICN